MSRPCSNPAGAAGKSQNSDTPRSGYWHEIQRELQRYEVRKRFQLQPDARFFLLRQRPQWGEKVPCGQALKERLESRSLEAELQGGSLGTGRTISVLSGDGD